MSFLWPQMLILIAVVPLGVLLYRWIGARRRRRVEALAGMGTGIGAVRSITGRRRFVPPTLAVLGLVVMAVGMARPQAELSLPRLEGTVILAVDVSASMGATDVAPSRIEAAKKAITAFVTKQPPSVQIGVVAFSDSGISVQAPTSDTAAVLAAVNRLTPQRGTSLAQGILAAVTAIDKAENPNAGYYTNRSPLPSPTPVPAGTHSSAVIVLLSDGENNQAPAPADAAQVAANRGIRVDTVAIGTAGGTTLNVEGFQVHTQLDAATLQQIASITGGDYYAADSASRLDQVYANLDSALVVKPQQTEVTALFAGAALLVLLLSGITGLLWLGRAP